MNDNTHDDTPERDPMLARATETSDFAIEDLITGDKPVSLYVIVPPEEISRRAEEAKAKAAAALAAQKPA